MLEVAGFSGLWVVPVYITTRIHIQENSYLQISALYSCNFLCQLQLKFADIISFPKETGYIGVLYTLLVDVQVNLVVKSYLVSLLHFILAFI